MKIEIPQLTFTRFLAAIAIVIFHYAAEIFPFNIPAVHYFISHANLGVCYFFVLSGCILSIVYEADFFTKSSAGKKFFIARFARIYPVYLIALLLGMASVWLYQRERFSIAAALSNALLVQAWIPMHLKTYNLPGWSLSVEAFFYFIFPWLIYKVFRESFRSSVIIASLVWLVSLIIYLIFNPGTSIAIENPYINFVTNPLMQVNNFLLGIAGGIAYRQKKFSIIKKNSNFFLAVSTILMLLIFFIPNPIVENARDGLLAPLFLLFILSLTYHKGTVTRLLSNKFLIYLGDISYGIYILQGPLGMWYKGALIKAGINLSNAAFIYSFILFLIAFSAFSYSFIEKPLRVYLRTVTAREQKVFTPMMK